MKKFLRFAFAVVALAGMVMASSCGKDDEEDGNEQQTTNGITLPIISVPAENSISGIPCTISWSSAQKDGSSTGFTYQVSLSDDGGQTWKTFDNQKLSSLKLTKDNLEADKIYYLKIITTYSDGTSVESDVRKFVAKYSKGTIGASELTENSITMEWGNLLPYEYVELSISDCSMDGNKIQYIYDNEQPAVKITEGNSYKFENLESEGSYAINYKYAISDETVISGTYYAMAIDGTKYVNDGKFNKIRLLEMNDKMWTLDFVESLRNCYGEEMSDFDDYLAYGFRPAKDNDVIDLLEASGYSEEEIQKHTVEDVTGKVDDCKSDVIANYYMNGLRTKYYMGIFATDDYLFTTYYIWDDGHFVRQAPEDLSSTHSRWNDSFMFIKD